MKEVGNPIRQIPAASKKLDKVYRHCFYMIASGKWSPGTKMPSLRNAEKEWGVNRLTVLKAYQILVERGYAESRLKSGFYVASLTNQDIPHDYHKLEKIYKIVCETVKTHSDILPLNLFRYLSHAAEMKSYDKPECAFIECSKLQAEGHAREISEGFNIPVLALTVDDVFGNKNGIPEHVRIAITTYFHIHELKDLANKSKLTIIAVPIEISADLINECNAHKGELCFLELDKNLVKRTEQDAQFLMNIKDPKVKYVSDIEAALKQMFKSDRAGAKSPLVLIAQADWAELDEKWKKHPWVRQILCTISDSAWPELTSYLGMPFGQNN